MSKTAVIVDYGLGNIFSVDKACSAAGFICSCSDDATQFAAYDALVLPGVGAFGDAIARLQAKGLDKAIAQFASSGRPVLGICLGMQLLFSESEEFGRHQGLNLLPGRVVRFPATAIREKVPQIQWNTIHTQRQNSKLLTDIEDGAFVYFLHSFYAIPDRREISLTTTNYAGTTYCSAVESKNVMGVQFHPERSGDVGMKLLRNFFDLA